MLLQHKKGVPTDAVFAGHYDEHGMWQARGGKTMLDFSLAFSDDECENVTTEVTTSPLPSSYWCKQVGGIRYVVAAVLESKIGKEPAKPLAVYREISVIESVNYTLGNEFETVAPHTSPLIVETSENVNQGFLGMGKKGIVRLSASIRVPKTTGHETGVWVSGNYGFVGVEIQNATTKHVKLNFIYR